MAKKKVAKKKDVTDLSKVDISQMSWNELRAFAIKNHVPAKGKRLKLEASIKERLKIPKQVVPKPTKSKKAESFSLDSRGSSVVFPIGQNVEVIAGEFIGRRGEVVAGDPVRVLLEFGGSEQFAARDLKKLPPIKPTA